MFVSVGRGYASRLAARRCAAVRAALTVGRSSDVGAVIRGRGRRRRMGSRIRTWRQLVLGLRGRGAMKDSVVALRITLGEERSGEQDRNNNGREW